MLKIDGIKLRPGEGEELLPIRAAEVLRVRPSEIEQLRIVRKSVDARETITFVYSVHVQVKHENKALQRLRVNSVSKVKWEKYLPPAAIAAPERPPVVVGAGPAGLFCALILAQAGVKPILLERGECVEQRQKDVEDFWRTGVLNTASNVQFGEGGAGTFSDGKLNTGTKDLRHRYILGKLVEFGAPESILIDAKPHVGTDYLHKAMINMRSELLRLGADIRFGHQVVDIASEDGALTALLVKHGEEIYRLETNHAVLALGHSARDTVEMLFDRGIHMEAKAFAVGVRIEHLQKDMDAAQYGKYAGHPSLPATSYKLSCHLDNGHSVFSFCVCPGGQVVAAASEEHRAVTNGMSHYARDKENINGALLVSVNPKDYGGDTSPLAGIAFQRKLEEAAYALGGGGYAAPAQLVGDFLAGRPSETAGKVQPSYRPGVTFTDLRQCLPDFVSESLALALPMLERKIRGFAQHDAVMTAVESRSSAPVRIIRDERYQSSLRGLYPCGEGAGYAGGIMSAATDGIRVAEQVLEGLK